MTTPTSQPRLWNPFPARPERSARRTRLAAVLAVVTLLAAACSADGGTTATTAPPDTTTTTTPPGSTTTTAASPDSTTTTSPTTSAPATTTPVPDTNSLAEGSGCTPGTTDRFPDGEWFGYVEDAAPTELDFDLACWFTGEGAARAAEEDGEESPPPNDYYVRNANTAIRTLAVGAGAGVFWMPNPGDPTTEETVAYSDWLNERTVRSYQPGAWLTISDGAIVEIREQYVP